MQCVLINSLVLERKHKSVKWAIKDRTNTVNLERGVMEEIVAKHHYDLGVPLLHAGLRDATRPSDVVLSTLIQEFGLLNLIDVWVSRNSVVCSRAVCGGDVVVFESGATDHLTVGKVWFHTQIRDTCFTCLAPWAHVFPRGERSSLPRPRHIHVHSYAPFD